MNVLVTGASGFIGQALVRRMSQQFGWSVLAATRGVPRQADPKGWNKPVIADAVRWVNLPDLPSPMPIDLFLDIEVVVHCAARVHVMEEKDCHPLAAFRVVNLVGTLQIAEAAARAGVRRFVFLSTVKVHGEETGCRAAFTADSPLHPADAYAQSKMEAEQALWKLSERTGLEIVIVRPPLVYGPGVKANFLSLMGLLNKGLPLPLGAIRNRRSLVGLDNLVDLLLVCVNHPNAQGQAFLVSDGADCSTTELLKRLGQALGKPPRLLPIPPALLWTAGVLLGRRAVVERICGSLHVDIGKTRKLLGWEPPVTLNEGLRRTADSFLRGD